MNSHDHNTQDNSCTIKDVQEFLNLGVEHDRESKAAERAISARNSLACKLNEKVSPVTTYLRNLQCHIKEEEESAYDSLPDAVKRRCNDRLDRNVRHSEFLESDAKHLKVYMDKVDDLFRKRREYDYIVTSDAYRLACFGSGIYYLKNAPMWSPFMTVKQYKEMFGIDED